MNGFDYNEMEVYHAYKIPEKIAKSYLKIAKRSWPWYVHEDFLKIINAEFRTIDNSYQTLIDEVVYQQGRAPRKIGARFLIDFNKNKIIPERWEEDIYSSKQSLLLMKLGICVARCQEIEHLIAHSFILGVSAKEKSKYRTINELTLSWKKKTLGQLIKTIEESYRLEKNFKSALDTFLLNRNKLVHGITMSEEFDIQTSWGQGELIAFLIKFEYISRAVRAAFRSCYFASIDFGNKHLIQNKKELFKLTKKQKEEASLFSHLFTLL